MEKKLEISISSLDTETINRVKAKFLRYPAYKQLCDEFDAPGSVELEDFVTYPFTSNFMNDRVTSSRSLSGQPERDALRYMSKLESGENAQQNVRLIEKALSGAIIASAKTSKPKHRDDIMTSLYNHLCLGVPMKMLRSTISSPTLAIYRDRAIVNAAINLGYVSEEQ